MAPCPLLELSQILNPGVPDEQLPPIMALAVYCDESETTGRVFTLAGWAGVPGGWGLFTPKWRDLLNCCGPNPVRAFHMVDLFSRRGEGEFKRWSRKERLAFAHHAGDIITDQSLIPQLFAVAASIEIEPFSRFLAWQPSPEDLYVLCFQSIFHQVVTHGTENSISFVMDEKRAVQDRVLAYFYEAKKVINEGAEDGKLRGISFEDDRVLIQLQAADFLAYEVRRGILNRRRDAVYAEHQPYTRLKSRQHDFRCYGQKFFENLVVAKREKPEQSYSELWFTVEAPED